MLGRITSGLLSRESKGGNNASLVFVLVAGRGGAGRGIPALPVHDSVIFPERHRETVRGAMEREFLLQTGQPIAVG